MKVWIRGRLVEVDRIVTSAAELEKAVEELGSGSTILWDEVSVEANARRVALLHETRRRMLQKALDDARERLRLLPEGD